MKIIVPMAGIGSRLRPHTLTIPKPLTVIAGKPIVQRLVEDITSVVNQTIDEIAFIIGPSSKGFPANTKVKLLKIAEELGAKGSVYVQEEALGTAHAIFCAKDSLTGAYLSGVKSIPTPAERRNVGTRSLKLLDCSLNNLEGLDVEFPLGRLVSVTGVSGSGKSTLVNELLHPALEHGLGRKIPFPQGLGELRGLKSIDKVIVIDQSPIGRTPRSNPATYTGAFDPIRQVFAATVEAKARGYQVGQFSFNVKGGRCEACRGQGVNGIEMNFLPDG